MKNDIRWKKKDRPTYSVVENVLFLWKRIRKVYPLLLFLMGVQCVFSVIGPVAGIWLPRVAVELAGQRAELTDILVRLGGLGLLLALSMGLASMAELGKYKMQNNLRFEYRVEIFMKALGCAYEKIESAQGQRRYNRAWYTLGMGDMSGTTLLNNAVVELFINLSCFVIYCGIISRLSFAVILLLVGLSLVNLLAVRYANAWEFRHRDEEAGISNRLNYIEWTARDVQYGKDIRLYGMEPWFLRLREQVMETYTRLNHRIRNRHFGADIVNAATLFLRDGIVYACLIGGVASGRILAGDFVLYFGAVTGFSGFVGKIVDSLNTLNRANLMMNDMRAFLDDAEESGQGRQEELHRKELPQWEKEKRPARQREAGSQEQSAEQGVSINFENVTFSYDKGGLPVLRNFSLHIGKGEKIALVGVNGVGKTTVIKLLCGFYQPDAGRILLGGRDIREFDREELYEQFSTVFQDVYIPPFTVAENISMKPEKDTDRERVIRCLKEAGLYEKICQYPEGIHSHMLKAVCDGIVLSGGQQQRLLMARALYRDAPVLILDEPTAALDPVAESETYENFHHFSSGRTAIYISHRLASTRFCDRIVLLKDGKVKEEGTHEELMRKDGEYARMYEIQSQYYRKGSRAKADGSMDEGER